MAFSLRCDAQSLELTRAGTIWGNIWLQSGGESFPETRWNDIAVAFVCEFSSAVMCVSDGQASSARVRFYDGPYWVELRTDTAGMISLTLGESSTTHATWEESTQEVVMSTLRGAEVLLDACHGRGWADQTDVIRLASAVRALSESQSR